MDMTLDISADAVETKFQIGRFFSLWWHVFGAGFLNCHI